MMEMKQLEYQMILLFSNLAQISAKKISEKYKKIRAKKKFKLLDEVTAGDTVKTEDGDKI